MGNYVLRNITIEQGEEHEHFFFVKEGGYRVYDPKSKLTDLLSEVGKNMSIPFNRNDLYVEIPNDVLKRVHELYGRTAKIEELTLEQKEVMRSFLK